MYDFDGKCEEKVDAGLTHTCNYLGARYVQEQGLFLVDAFNSILEFGAANKPNVLRALVGRLTVLWMQSPGGSKTRQRWRWRKFGHDS